MNHAFFPSLCLAFAITAAPVLHAQDVVPDTQAAIDAAVRRENKLMEARNLINQGRTLEAQRDIVPASQTYNKALQSLREIGGAIEPERTDAVAGLARTTLIIADQEMRSANFAGAKVHIDRVLAEDPKNKLALDMRTKNNRMIAETYDKMPHDNTLKVIELTETNRVEVAKLVQDGKLYYETGRLNESEKALRDAIKLDPDNKAAAYYLDLVNARRYSEELRLRDVNSKQMMLEVERQWADNVKRETLPVPNIYARTNIVHTGVGRQKVYEKLQRIRLNDFMVDKLPLGEVIKQLDVEARRRDLDTNPISKGVNFLISPNADSATAPPPTGLAGAGRGLPGGAPIPGAELPAPAAEPIDLVGGVTITVSTPLHDISLEEALNIVTMVADKKIKYSVEDWGVVISPKPVEDVPLHTRFFKVDPNTFWQGLANVTALDFGESQNGGGGGGGRGGGRNGGGNRGGNRGGNNFGGNNQNGGGSGGGATYAGVSIAPGGNNGRTGQQGGGGRAVQQTRPGVGGAAGGAGGGAIPQGSGGIDFLTDVTPSAVVIPQVKLFFSTAGVNLDDPGKAVFFNDRLGVLMVRASLQDLDTIEKAVQMLNMAPPQLTIRAKFMEVTQDDNRALGFDWYLGNTLMNNGSIGAQAGTAPSFTGAPTPANPSGVFPGPGVAPGVPGPFATPASGTDNLLTGGLRNSAPALASVTGILTDPQFKFVVRALEQRGGTDLLSCPEVTTLSGRQAQIKVVDVRYIVTDLDLDQTAAGGGLAGTGAVTTGGGIGTTIQPTTEPFELGPVLDVVPYVNADGYTITMTLLPTLKEFLGYDDPGQFVAQAQSVGGSGPAATPLVQPTPLPKFRLRQVATTAMVWDGQTVVLGGLISENVQKQKDKVPVLGDLPYLGRFFRSESNISSKKNLVIFVTPTMIDPSGNRMHSDEEMPYAAQHSVPPQLPRVVTP